MRRDKYSELARRLQPHLGRQSSTVTISGGGGVGSHVHSFADLDGELAESQAPWVATSIADAIAQFKPHNILDAIYHSVTGAQYSIIGLTATDTLGLLTSTADGAANHDTILRSGSAGDLTLDSLITPLIDSPGDLTLSPAGLDVILDSSVALVSSNYESEVAGWKIPSTGAADILSVTTNELTSRQSLYAGATGFRVLFHTHDYDHVHVVVNPGEFWNLDEQFGVDIDDNLLVRGYIVGKHAIQLPGAMMICHYDGAEPYETNYTGNATGHMGQAATASGGVIYRPGKFGKAVQIAEATTNGCANPSAETGLAGWFIQYNGGTLTQEQTGLHSLYGSYSVKMVATGASSYVYNAPHFHAPAGGITWNNGETVTLSCYVKGSGTWRVVFEDQGQNLRSYDEVTLGSDWQRIVITQTNSTGVDYFYTLLSFFPQGAGTIYVDGVQYEAKSYATPYADGSMGDGHSWSGDVHASTSTRTAAALSYPANTVLPPTAITVGMWVNKSAAWPGTIVSHPSIGIEFLA